MNPETHHDVAGQGRPSVRKLVIDPSDAVTGMSLVFGIVGAVMGVVSAVIVSDTWNAALILYCFLAAFAGG